MMIDTSIITQSINETSNQPYFLPQDYSNATKPYYFHTYEFNIESDTSDNYNNLNSNLYIIYMNNLFFEHSLVDELFTDNSSLKAVVSTDVEHKLFALISSPEFKYSDSLIDSEFAPIIVEVIDKYGDEILDLIYSWFSLNCVDIDVASELVILVGRIETKQIQARRKFLELCLQFKSSARIRFASVLAIAYADDPYVIPTLKTIIEAEPLESLRKDMNQLLIQLEKTMLEKM